MEVTLFSIQIQIIHQIIQFRFRSYMINDFFIFIKYDNMSLKFIRLWKRIKFYYFGKSSTRQFLLINKCQEVSRLVCVLCLSIESKIWIGIGRLRGRFYWWDEHELCELWLVILNIRRQCNKKIKWQGCYRLRTKAASAATIILKC